MRRPLPLLVATCLALTLVAGAVSFVESFALVWRGQAVGASNGLAIWSYTAAADRSFTLLYEPSPAIRRALPGAGYLGFHYLASGRFRLIAIPLWLPAVLAAIALPLCFRASRRRRNAGPGFDLRSDDGARGLPSPPTITPPTAPTP